MVNIIIHGLGRLGGAVAALARGDAHVRAVAGIYRSSKDALFDFPIFGSLKACGVPADVLVDCSIAPALPAVLAHAVESALPLVICTTAHEQGHARLIDAACSKIPVFVSGNMSLGVNLMLKLVANAAQSLINSDFDIEIIESHHNQKLDAPSGTALMLLDAINSGAQTVYDRTGALAKRSKNEIGIHCVRGGSITGSHTVLFAGSDETLEIKHSALSRDVFARGVLACAKFISTQAPGLYNMNDLLYQPAI